MSTHQTSQKLVDSPPAYPCRALTNLLDTVAQSYPQIFYKPLFSCAASSKEFSVVNHLCVIVIVAKFLPDFWIRDAEMLSVALMSDVGTRKGSTSASRDKSWAEARLGQSVLMLELIGFIQAVRHEKEAANVRFIPQVLPPHLRSPLFSRTQKVCSMSKLRSLLHPLNHGWEY